MNEYFVYLTTDYISRPMKTDLQYNNILPKKIINDLTKKQYYVLTLTDLPLLLFQALEPYLENRSLHTIPIKKWLPEWKTWILYHKTDKQCKYLRWEEAFSWEKLVDWTWNPSVKEWIFQHKAFCKDTYDPYAVKQQSKADLMYLSLKQSDLNENGWESSTEQLEELEIDTTTEPQMPQHCMKPITHQSHVVEWGTPRTAPITTFCPQAKVNSYFDVTLEFKDMKDVEHDLPLRLQLSYQYHKTNSWLRDLKAFYSYTQTLKPSQSQGWVMGMFCDQTIWYWIYLFLLWLRVCFPKDKKWKYRFEQWIKMEKQFLLVRLLYQVPVDQVWELAHTVWTREKLVPGCEMNQEEKKTEPHDHQYWWLPHEEIIGSEHWRSFSDDQVLEKGQVMWHRKWLPYWLTHKIFESHVAWGEVILRKPSPFTENLHNLFASWWDHEAFQPFLQRESKVKIAIQLPKIEIVLNVDQPMLPPCLMWFVQQMKNKKRVQHSDKLSLVYQLLHSGMNPEMIISIFTQYYTDIQKPVKIKQWETTIMFYAKKVSIGSSACVTLDKKRTVIGNFSYCPYSRVTEDQKEPQDIEESMNECTRLLQQRFPTIVSVLESKIISRPSEYVQYAARGHQLEIQYET